MTQAAPPIGFIGLGMMGTPMASLLVKAGLTVCVNDAQIAAIDRFVAERPARKAATLAELADCAVVFLMLPDSNIVDAVVLGQGSARPDGSAGAAGSALVDVLPKGALIVDMSSSEPLRTRALAERVRARGLRLVDAPVSGGVKRAVDGSLAMMVGGQAADVDDARPLLQRMARSITHVGPTGAGHAAKALNNYVSAAGLVATVEALHAAKRFGLDPAVLTDVFNHSTGKNNTTENKVKSFMLSARFDSGFALALMAKDLGIAMSLGDAVGSPMVLGQQVLALWRDGDAALGKGADHTEMYRWLDPDRR